VKKAFILPLIISGILFSCSEENPIENEAKPEACFSWTTETNIVGSEILFSNCSKNATHYFWTFGDGEISTQSEPSHIFKKQGTYEIHLLAGEDKNQDGILDLLDDPGSLKKTITIDPNHLAVELTILTTSSWSIENPVYVPVPNAVVSLYKEYPAYNRTRFVNDPESIELGEPDYTLESDDEGKLMIYDEDVDAVCFVVEHNGESNIVDGHLIAGVFGSQEEIDGWAYIWNAVVGSYKYLDLDEDGNVSSWDMTACEGISISLDETYRQAVYIGE